MTQTYDANAVLMGGGGAPAWKFTEPGDSHTGTIKSPPQARQERDYDPNNPGGGDLKFFPSGDPIMGVVVELQTNERDPSNAEDDGTRTFYVEGRYIKEAVRNAVRAAGASGLEVGGGLQVTFTHREDPMDKRSRKFWQVAYTPAGNAALMTPETAQAQPVQQAVPAPQAAPQPVQQVQQAPAPQPAPPVPQPAPAPQAAPAPAPAAQQPTPEAMAAFMAWQQQQAQQAG